jgi:hypothetical protein
MVLEIVLLMESTAPLAACLFTLIVWPRGWKQYIPPKHQCTSPVHATRSCVTDTVPPVWQQVKADNGMFRRGGCCVYWPELTPWTRALLEGANSVL